MKRNIPTIYLTPSTNTWYQTKNDRKAIDFARRIADDYKTVLTYGSSMGGFAALAFAGAFRATAALAIMPQYSIDPAMIDGEKRWLLEASRINFDPAPLRDFPKDCRAYVAYDPFFKPDVAQIKKIKETIPATILRCPLMGHSGPGAEATKTLLEAAIAKRFDEVPSLFIKNYREKRRTTSTYYMQLARLSRSLSEDKRFLLLLQAKTHNSLDNKVDLSLSELLMRVGRYREANFVEKACLKDHPKFAQMWGRLGQSHAALGQFNDAKTAVLKAIDLSPHTPYFHHQYAGVLLKLKDFSGAEASQMKAIAMDSQNKDFHRHLEWIQKVTAYELSQNAS